MLGFKSRILLSLLIALLALLVYALLPASCPEMARRCAAIFVVAAGFWVLELLPLYATSLFVVLLLALFLGREKYALYLAPFASPIMILFFGGFLLAQALKKQGIDQFLASKLINRFNDTPGRLLFGVMAMTALLSMWISNTASALIMMSIVQRIYLNESLERRLRCGILLAIPFGANIGGMATPIGTPPNAIAIGSLFEAGVRVDFPDWILLCFPLMCVILALAYAILRGFYLQGIESLPPLALETKPLDCRGKETLLIICTTILLWLTAPFHLIPEAVIALMSASALIACDLIGKNDLKSIDWDVLILIWGGLALGVGLEESGLGSYLVHSLLSNWSGLPLAALFGTIALGLSLFISNTAASALVVPIAIEAGGELGATFGITAALMCSLGMAFPISTPPNAIAYGTGLLSNREMLFAGSLITLFGYMVILLGFWWIIPLWEWMPISVGRS